MDPAASPDELVYFASFIGSSISFAGIFYILITYSLYDQLKRNPVYKSLFFLIFANFMLAVDGYIPYFTEVSDTNPVCTVTGIFTEFAKMSSLLWTPIFAKSLQESFINETTFIPPYRRLMVFCVMIPAIFAVVPYYLGYYGATGLSCWIRESLASWRLFSISMILYYGPFMLILIYNIYTHMITYIYLRKFLGPSWEFLQLFLYPAVMLLGAGFGFVYKLQISFTDGSSEILKVTTISLIQLQGFFDALIYGTNYQVRGLIRKSLKNLWNSRSTRVRTNSSILINEGITLG